MVLAGIVEVSGTEPLTAGSGLRRVDIAGLEVVKVRLVCYCDSREDHSRVMDVPRYETRK
jgi:hypothetical protein